MAALASKGRLRSGVRGHASGLLRRGTCCRMPHAQNQHCAMEAQRKLSRPLVPRVARKLPLLAKLQSAWVVAATRSQSQSRRPAGSLSFERVHDSTRAAAAAAAGSGLRWKSVVAMVERKTPPLRCTPSASSSGSGSGGNCGSSLWRS